MRTWKVIAALLIGLVVAPALVGAGVIAFEVVKYRARTYNLDLPPVAGYTGKYSFERGEPIELFIHSTAPAKGTLLRLADHWQAVGEPVPIPAQIQSNRFHMDNGMGWDKSLTIDSSPLPGGLYQLRIEQDRDPGHYFSVPILIKDTEPHKIGVVLSTNTWDAYNTFGGLSHYENHYFSALTAYVVDSYSSKVLQKYNKFRPSRVSFFRPNSIFSEEVNKFKIDKEYSSYLVRNEMEFLSFLTRNGYQYSIYEDFDMENHSGLHQSKLLIFPGHTEYWTDAMFYGFERYLAGGGRAFRSIAGMEGRVTRDQSGLRFERPVSREAINMLVGAYTDSEGQFTAAPYRTLCPGHWTFAGTGLGLGDLFGKTSANHPSFDIPGHQHYSKFVDLTGKPQQGASGFFTSKVGRGSGMFSVLAIGTNPEGPANMVYRDTPQGGWIFNAGSDAFNGALLRDDALARLIRNLIDDAVTGSPPAGRQTSCDGSLRREARKAD